MDPFPDGFSENLKTSQLFPGPHCNEQPGLGRNILLFAVLSPRLALSSINSRLSFLLEGYPEEPLGPDQENRYHD
jgi:hypothetical protein